MNRSPEPRGSGHAAPSPGKWALVTGASSGIGMELARELARRGHHLVLLGRDEPRLARLSREVAETHGAAARIFARDLSNPAAVVEICEALEGEGLPVSVLVNNAGFGVYGPFAQTRLEQELALVNLQVHALVILTKACLPGMLRRREGKILNVASVYAYTPVPQQSVYAACKSFMLSFSESLAAELEGTGVSVTVLCPGITATAFRTRSGKHEKLSWLSMDAQTVAAIACRGLFRNKPVVVPGTINRLYVLGAGLLPRRLLVSLTRQVNRLRGLGAPS
jgi:short-subunit dehydrogenase